MAVWLYVQAALVASSISYVSGVYSEFKYKERYTLLFLRILERRKLLAVEKYVITCSVDVRLFFSFY